MKRLIFALVALCCSFWAPVAPGTVLSYDVVVDAGGGWFGATPRPYGLPPQPGPLFATLTVDNTRNDKTGVLDFYFVTGTKSWTEDLVSDSPMTTLLNFSSSGDLSSFLMSFADPVAGALILASNNTLNMNDGNTAIACNGCVHFSPAAPARAAGVPVPGTLALLLGACAAGALTRRRALAG